MRRNWKKIALALLLFAVVGGTADAATSTIPTVKIHCAYIQGGHGVSEGDLNVRKAGAVKRFCFVGKQGIRGPAGPQGATGPQGPQGATGADGQSAPVGLAVCSDAQNGQADDLELCPTHLNANDIKVGYLVLSPNPVPLQSHAASTS